MILVNPSSSLALTGTARFFDARGQPMSVGLTGLGQSTLAVFGIPPLSTVTLSSDGQGRAIFGSALVVASRPIGGALRLTAPGFGTAGLGASPTAAGLIVPARLNRGQGLDLAVAVASAGDSATTLQLTLRDRQGQPIAGGGRSVTDFPPGGHLVGFIGDLFPGATTDSFEGTLTVTAGPGAKIAAAALEIAPGRFTTVPAVPLR